MACHGGFTLLTCLLDNHGTPPSHWGEFNLPTPAGPWVWSEIFGTLVFYCPASCPSASHRADLQDGMGESKDKRWTEWNIFHCSVKFSPMQPRSELWPTEPYGSLISLSPDEFFTAKQQSSLRTSPGSSLLLWNRSNTNPQCTGSRKAEKIPPEWSHRHDFLLELQLP